MAINPIPAPYQTLTPYLIVQDAAAAIAFYQQAFGAVEIMRLVGSDSKITHAEIQIDGAILMLANEFPEMGFCSPQTIGGTAVSIVLYVEAVDLQFQQALAAGAVALRPVTDQFFGDRSGSLKDPFGHLWILATPIEKVSLEEMQRRFTQSLEAST